MGVNHDIRSSFWFVRVFIVVDQDDNLITKLVMNLFFDANPKAVEPFEFYLKVNNG